MTVYNINLGINWANSGIEYAQAYRAKILKRLGIPAKFIFSNILLANNLETLTSHLGLADDQVIWLYNFFTDVKIAPTTYRLAQFERSLAPGFTKTVLDDGRRVQYTTGQVTAEARVVDRQRGTIDRVLYFNQGRLIQDDSYSYVRYASTYYYGREEQNNIVARDFYNEDGSRAYTQHFNNGWESFEFSNHQVIGSKDELYRAMLQKLHFQKGDVIMMDRLDEDPQLANGELILENHGPAKLVVPIHADHYAPTNDGNILWNGYYDYQFNQPTAIDCFLFSTDQQRSRFVAQQLTFDHCRPQTAVIPVGSLTTLRHPVGARRPFSLITASRLAPEKHLDWLIQAVVLARRELPDLTLDIYGEGVERAKLADQIEAAGAGDYIRLMGQHDLTTVYTKYAAYASASTGEGFGLSILEAIGAGLPVVGFDVPYGNQTMIDDGQNGYRVSYAAGWSTQEKAQRLAQGISRLFGQDSLTAFRQHSYQLATPYLDQNVGRQWQQFLRRLNND